MGKVMTCVAFTAILCCFLPTTVTAQAWGEWGQFESCPYGERAVGFSLKTEREQGDDDDTAVNSIAMKCTGGSWIYSSQGERGDWGKEFICPDGGYLNSCELRIQPDQGDEDNTAVNNMRCYCDRGNVLLEGDGLSNGDWDSATSKYCAIGFKSIKTKVQKETDGDNTGLNYYFLICYESIYDYGVK